jgi:hypothetical protein
MHFQVPTGKTHGSEGVYLAKPIPPKIFGSNANVSYTNNANVFDDEPALLTSRRWIAVTTGWVDHKYH